MRSLQPIVGVAPAALDEYSPEAFDAVLQPDGTYTLVPVLWTTQAEFNEYAFGCGRDD